MIYVFDLDGTLCDTTGRDYVNAHPVQARIARVNALYDAGHVIVIDTARGSVSSIEWEPLTRRQLAQWGVCYHTLRVGKKTYGDVYVDDKAVNADQFFTCES